MKSQLGLSVLSILLTTCIYAQDLTKGLIVNDLDPHPMQELAKPGYLQSTTDPSFNTTIRRISNASEGNFIVPMYSTVQAWNADESLMILYQGGGTGHILLDGMQYNFIRTLDDINPTDLEDVFWHFSKPEILFYVDDSSNELIEYNVNSQVQNIIADLGALSNCPNVAIGNDVQMMSWDSNIIGFRCGNTGAYSYNIATGELTSFNINTYGYVAPNPGPSGSLFMYQDEVYDSDGNFLNNLNVQTGSEHSCIGKMTNGNDAYFAISFASGPDGGCLSSVNAHDLTNYICYPLLPDSDYGYPQSGTHISAVSHNNSEKGWLCASMMGYDQDGQDLLDQEIIIAKADPNNIKICRIAHHRSDEDEFDYWGEPHAVMSPKGTRVLFASDWSGTEDGNSVDSYVVELPSFTDIDLGIDILSSNISLIGNQNFSIVVSVQELSNNSATENGLTLSIPKDSRFILNYNQNLDNLLGVSLENSNWIYDNTNPDFHIWNSNTIISAGASNDIGINIQFDALNSDGQSNITAHVRDIENEEINTFNNSHSVSISYAHE